MRVPLSWLREFVQFDLTPEQLAERLTLLGMEVQKIEQWGADWRNVVVGELLEVEKHPRADRLSLTRVTVGDGEPLEIVCGATNIAAGQRVPVALPGAVLPGDRRIERTEKMGVVSNGMLCSGEELNLTSDGDGILILPETAPLGAPLTELYGDVVLDVDVKPNRGDALSIVGLAREVAAVTGGRVELPPIELREAGQPTTERLTVDVEDPDLCPRFVGRWVSGVTVGPSPDRIQMRLLAAGQRPLSNVVDASNYVMIELGKPIHTFDAHAVHDGRLIVRRARAGERLETLDHVTRELDPDTLLIADPTGPIGIAGVMGGTTTEVTDATTEVIVESAVFDPVSIRRTAFHYALRSEASLHFEKGQEFRLVRLGADRAAQLVAEWAGGAVAPGRVDTNPSEPAPARVAFRPARVNRLLGTAIPVEEQRTLLGRVGVATENAPSGVRIPVAGAPQPLDVAAAGGEALLAVVPTWRRDIHIEADVAEEVARVRGYETIEGILPHTPMPSFRPSPLELRDAARETLAGAGVSEVVTPALVAPGDSVRFGPRDDGELAGEPEQRGGGGVVTVTNPLSSQHSVLRQSLVGSLLEVVGTNRRHGRHDVAVFEVGKGYGTADGGGTREWWRLGIALAGSAVVPSWNQPARAFDLDDAKGLVELLARRLGYPSATYEPLHDDPNLHPGRTARIRVTGEGGTLVAGRAGELHPALADELDLDGPVIVAELAVAGLASGLRSPARGATPPRHPAVERDLAVVVAEDRPAADVAAAIRHHGGRLLTAVDLFDVYRGRPLDATEKSLAWRLHFQAPDRTLTEDEVDTAIGEISAGLAADTGARIRS
ncbi:MAG TPA: phenylalanine--tRNA ligase subunit beta [Candidatus Limnocylindrales bacterium]|nr:phenylalanine--tRNA ligase subunit beta [Candidatus Limnocylindrales bacterium]